MDSTITATVHRPDWQEKEMVDILTLRRECSISTMPSYMMWYDLLYRWIDSHPQASYEEYRLAIKGISLN